MFKRLRAVYASSDEGGDHSKSMYNNFKRLWQEEKSQEAMQLCSKDGQISMVLVNDLLHSARKDQDQVESLIHALNKEAAPDSSSDNFDMPQGLSILENHTSQPAQAIATATTLATPSSVTTLPDEILIDIFKYLDFEDRLACLAACQRWRKVVTSEPMLWSEGTLLTGTLDQIDAQWKRLSVLLQGQKIRYLRLELSQDALPYGLIRGLDILRYFGTLSFAKSFPTDTLEDFEYTSSRDELVNEQVWALVAQCSQLRSLYWDADELRYYKREPFIYEIGDAPLANCRLEDFRFSAKHNCRLDKRFAQVLSKAKVIHLDALLQYWRVHRILVAAKDTLEDAYLREVISHPSELEAEMMLRGEIHTEIQMPKLRKYQAEYKGPPIASVMDSTRGASYHIIAPHLTELDIFGYNMMDYRLLNSCQSSLVKLDCTFLEKRDLLEEVRQLLTMPQCEELVLHDSPGIISFIPANGDRLEDDGTGHRVTLDRVLPKLKVLKIQTNKDLTGANLVNWIQQRIRLGNHSIEEIVLLDCPNIDFQAISTLESLVPLIVHSKAPPQIRCGCHHTDNCEHNHDDIDEHP